MAVANTKLLHYGNKFGSKMFTVQAAGYTAFTLAILSKQQPGKHIFSCQTRRHNGQL